MNEEILKNIWEALSSDGMTSSNYETWKQNFINKPEVRANIHEYLISNNYTKSDFNTWYNNIGTNDPVKKKVPSSSVGQNQGTMASSASQQQVEGILSDLQFDKETYTPQPDGSKDILSTLQSKDKAYTPDELVQPITETKESTFDPTKYVAPEQPIVPDSEPIDVSASSATKGLNLRVSEGFDTYYNTLDNAISSGLVKDEKEFKEKFPEIKSLSFEEGKTKVDFAEKYNALSDDIKVKIEPAVVRENGVVVGINPDLISKKDIEYLKTESLDANWWENFYFGNSEQSKLILQNVVPQQKIEYLIEEKKLYDLQESLTESKNEIERLANNGYIEKAQSLVDEHYLKIEQYKSLSNSLNDKSILINSLEIAKDNTSMNPIVSMGASATERAGSSVIMAFPSLAATGINLIASFPGMPSEITSMGSEVEKYLMQGAMNINKEWKDFVPTDSDDTVSNFIGDVIGQQAFVVGAAMVGGMPAAIAAGYTMSMAEMYEESINNGLSHDNAMYLSKIYGMVSAPLELLPVENIINRATGDALKKEIIKQVLKYGAEGFTKEIAEQAVKLSFKPIIKEGLKEAAAEGVQESAQYMLSKGLAEAYNEYIKEDGEADFKKADLGSKEFWKELGQNFILGSAGGFIGGTSMNILQGNVYTGSNYKAIESMLLDPKQLSKINDQLTAYRRNGTIETDEDLEIAKQQIGILQESAAHVERATKAMPESFGIEQQKRTFALVSEKISIEKEIEGMMPILAETKKAKIEEIDNKIRDIASGKITEADLIAEKTQVVEETVTEIATEATQTAEKVNAVPSKKSPNVDKLFEEDVTETSEKISGNLARNKSKNFELSKISQGVVDAATKAAKAIETIIPKTRIVLHDTDEEFNSFYKDKKGGGLYDPNTNTIHVNLSSANKRTIAHEVFHAIVYNKLGDEYVLGATKDMYASVKRSLALNPKKMRDLRKFSEAYEEDYQSDEFVSELFGYLASDFKQLSAPVKLKVKQWINNIANKFNLSDIIKLTEQDLSDLETIEILNTLSSRVKSGETITEEDTAKLQNKKAKPDKKTSAVREQKDVSDVYKKIGMTPEQVQDWKSKNTKGIKMPHPIEAQNAAKDYASGLITLDEYDSIIKESMPIIPYTKVPKPATLEEVVLALKANQVSKGILGLTAKIEDGTESSSRLDITAYSLFGIYIDTIHGPNGKGILGYGQTAVLKNVNFGSNASKALGVATRTQAKSPFAVMNGSYFNESTESVVKRAEEALKSNEWVQVGFNPYRHAYFYDKANSKPVESANEVIQIGPLVMAKGVKYGKPLESKNAKTGGTIRFQLSDDHSIDESGKGTFNLNKGAKRIGQIALSSLPFNKSNPNFKYVELAQIDLDERGKGLGVDLYREVADVLASRGQVMASRGFRNEDSERIWKSLVRDGYAQKIGENKSNGKPIYAMLPTDPLGEVAASSTETNNIYLQENETGKIQPKRTGDGRERRTEGSAIKSLQGSPTVQGATGPDPRLVSVAEKYAAENGIDFKRQSEYVEVDENRAKRLADEYAKMTHDPKNPKVKEAYSELIKQTKAQYKALVDAGYKFWFIDLNDAKDIEYISSPYNAMRDLRKNKEMGVFPTEAGFGTDESIDVSESPLLERTGIEWALGGLEGEMMPVTANDLFRAVHDTFGHGLEGAGFRARGEENAWQAHVRLFTGPAIGAITTETRGQNSWVNYGPNGEQNKTASSEDTIFADQKTGLMPSWTWEEGRAGDAVIREQKGGLKDAITPGSRITTSKEETLFKGMQAKTKNGMPFSVHKIKQGSFAALDINLAMDYKGDKPLKQFTIPSGTTIDVYKLAPEDSKKGMTIARDIETAAIDASDAQVVKLLTYDSRGGVSQQYIIKDKSILSTSKDVKDKDVSTGDSNPVIREQKGLITLTEQDVLKYKRIGIDNPRVAQAMNQIGLSGVKFSKEQVEIKIFKSLKNLLENTDSYLLSKDSPAITAAIKYEIETLENEGASIERIERAKSALNEGSPMRANFIENYINAQKETIGQWKSYLSQSEYDVSFKYLILDAVLTNNYDFKEGKYTKRTDKTIRNFTSFDAGSLASIYDSDSKAILKDYVEVQANNMKNIVDASEMVSTKEGKWVKFNGGRNAKDLEYSANQLSQLVQNTYWCTKTNALYQLRGGDFYVYVTEDGKGDFVSRIAVRMNGDKVGEVRGNASSKQDLEPDMLPVADKFLRNNIPNDSGKKWLDSIEYNSKVKSLTESILTKKLGREEIKEYISLISDSKKFSVDYGENGLVTKLKEKFENADFSVSVARNITELTTNTVLFIGDFKPSEKLSANKFPEIVLGLADFGYYKATDLGKLKTIEGDASFQDSQITDLGNLTTITGFAYFTESNVNNLGNLTTIGGDAFFYQSKITNLGGLESIGGNARFTESNVDNLGNLTTIGGSAYFAESEINSLRNLTTIGGDAYFQHSQITDLGNLTSIGGDVDFFESNVTDLGNLTTIGGDVDFNNSKVTNLGNLTTIVGDADFKNSEIISLGNLTTIGGSADFVSSVITDLGNLTTIGSSADFDYSVITDLGNLTTIGGRASFNNSKVTNFGNLTTIGGNARFFKSQVTDLGNLTSIGGNADFMNSQVADLGDLKSIGGDAYFTDSEINSLRNLTTIGGDAFFEDSQITDLGNLTSIGGNVYFDNSNLEEQWDERNDSNIREQKIPVATQNRITGIIVRLKKKIKNPNEIAKKVIANVQSRDPWYINEANDTEREYTIRFINKLLGLKSKAAPTANKILGKIKEIKKITYNEQQALVDQLTIAQELGNRGKTIAKEVAKNLNEELNNLAKNGKITIKQAVAIINRLNKVDLLMPSQVENFVDYMAKILNNADYFYNIGKIKKILPSVKKNLKRGKIGASNVYKILDRLASVEPQFIPINVLEDYISLMEMFSARAAELTLEEERDISEKADMIMQEIEIQKSLVSSLSDVYSQYILENEVGSKKYSEILDEMISKKIITEEDKKVMLDYKTTIVPSAKKEAKSDAQIEEERKAVIAEIKENAKDGMLMGRFALRDERVLVATLRKLINTDAINDLSINDLRNLLKVVNNINNGFVSNTAQNLKYKLNAINRGKMAFPSFLKGALGGFTKRYSKFKKAVTFSERGVAEIALRSIPKYYMDQALGDFKSRNVFDAILKAIAQAEQLYLLDTKSVRERLEKARMEVFKSLGRNPNSLNKSSAKQMFYMIQLEYLSNSDKTKVKEALDYLNKTIALNKIPDRHRDMLIEIRNEFAPDGKTLDIKKMYDSFNDAEKKSIKLVQDINKELADKAIFASAVIRGNRIDLIENYVHHVVVDENFDGINISDGKSLADTFNESRKPSTKAKSFIERTNSVTALNFDIYNSAQRGAKNTLLDYHLTEPIVTSRMVMKNVEKRLKDAKVFDENRDLFNSINDLLDNTIKTLLFNNSTSTDFIEDVVQQINKAGYQAVLVSSKRFISEAISNLSFAMWKGRAYFIEGIKHYGILSSQTGVDVMKAVKSLQIARVYPNAEVSSRYIDAFANETANIKGSKNKSAIANNLSIINNYTLKPTKNFADNVANVVLSTPDKALNRPLWFGAFATEFKKQTGQDVDFERIAAQDEAYMSKYEEAIAKSSTIADDISIEAGASEGLFTGISKGKDWKEEKNEIKMLIKFIGYNYNNYMNRFMVYEYQSFVKGLQAAMGNGMITEKEGRQLMAAVTTRMTMYSFLANMMGNGFLEFFKGLFGFGEPDDEKSWAKKLGQASLSTVSSLFLGRNFGNIARSIINFAVEYGNEKYLDALRDGDYDKYKDALVYAPNLEDKSWDVGMFNQWQIALAGPYAPPLKTLNLGAKVFLSPEKETYSAQERAKKEMYYRLPIEAASAAGLLPAAKEWQNAINNYIYADLKRANSNQKPQDALPEK